MTTSSYNKQFAIIKFQPNNIVLLHKPTKKTYQYHQNINNVNMQLSITHPYLLRPIVYNNGLLYLKGKSTLQIEIENRKRAYNLHSFAEEQILNTFIPIIQCLQFIHENNIIHGAISASSIIITDQQEIKLKDWISQNKENPYYPNTVKNQLKKQDDWAALCQILLQTTILKKNSKIYSQKDCNHALQGLIQKYSKGFIFAIIILFKKNKDKISSILNYLNNEEKYLNDIQLNMIYETIKKQKEKKKIAITNENVNIIPTLQNNVNNLKPLIMTLTQSPVKKSTTNNNSLGNTLRRVKEDNENKKNIQGINEDLKKKQIQKINKIIERSNQFVNELMARKNNEQILKKIAPKPNIAANISMYSEVYKKQIKDSPVIGSSPTKKIRTISKKK